MTTKTGHAAHGGPGFAETVALIALLMGLMSLSIDTMLPALPLIGGSYGIDHQNDLQLVIYVYMIGFSIAQLVYGPISDSYGRRPALLVGLAILMAGASWSAAAGSFEHLLAARFLQGIGAAAVRVLAVSMVRDRYAGREMARVMSFVMIVFILVPVVAPSYGGLVLLLADWRWIFMTMAVGTLLMTAWFYLRMPETLHPEYRRPLSFGSIRAAARLCVLNREAFGYSTVIGLIFGTLMGYIGSAEQVLGSNVYGLGELFPLAFASVAISGGVSAYVNARLVRRYGMRRLAHGSHIIHIATAGLLLGATVLFAGRPPLAVFMFGMMVLQFFFSCMMANYNAMALDPLGSVAGMASSLIGCYTTLIGTVVGSLIGQSFDGTIIPLIGGTFVISSVALAIVLWTEKGRLFRPHHEHDAAPATGE